MHWYRGVGKKNRFILKDGNGSLLNISFLALKKPECVDDVFLMGFKESVLKTNRFMNKRIVPAKGELPKTIVNL